jgi:glycosyltransferase involved in cell wall biosynthesis
MQVNQIVVSAAPGDAVTNSALEYRSLLRRIGPSEIFAQHVDPDLAGDVHQLSSFHHFDRGARRPTDDLILFHGSIGAPEVFSFVMGRPERIVLVYHNVSPAPMYRAYDPAFAGLLETGRRDIARLAGKVAMALAPSAYNAMELVTMGYRDVRIVPLVVDVDRLRALPPDADVASWLDDIEGPVLLYVGQLMPHKQPERLLQAFHALSTYLRPDAHLVLAGASRSAAYLRRFETYSRELNLPHLHVLGPVSDAALATLYRRTDVLVSTSSHEGFWVSPVEAMAFDVPVVARGCAAIPETVGDAGVLIPPEAGCLLFAEAVNEVLSNESLRADLVVRGRRRIESFRPDDARATFLRQILSVA